jgi:hypothetical protein
MKGQAVPSKYQQRKEARRKENKMQQPTKREEQHQEARRKRRAIIYMCEPNTKHDVTEPSVSRQRSLCRQEAKWLGAEVVGEFLDIREFGLGVTRPGLYQALELAREQRVTYLILTSLDVLADFDDDRFQAAWHLGRAGTIPMLAKGD